MEAMESKLETLWKIMDEEMLTRENAGQYI